jgi:hypothetical protein
MKQVLSASERLRNERVRELMLNRNNSTSTRLPEKLTQQQLFKVKEIMREGISRENAIKKVLWDERRIK